MENGGIIRDASGVDHNGLAYIADSEASADAAMRETASLIRKNFPGQEASINLYFGYQRPDGTIHWVRRTW
jgi:hypothetical protein